MPKRKNNTSHLKEFDLEEEDSNYNYFSDSDNEEDATPHAAERNDDKIRDRSNFNHSEGTTDSVTISNDDVEYIDTNWEVMFARLQLFHDEHGHCLVSIKEKCKPKKYLPILHSRPFKAYYEQKLSLGVWVSQQRGRYQRQNMSEEQRLSLENIGFIWNVSEHVWFTMWKRLVAYGVQHHDCNVPIGYELDLKLGGWVNTQRSLKTRGKLDLDREQMLTDVDFVWNSQQLSWRTQFNRLVAYKAQHRDCNVPHRYERDLELGCWVSKQRAIMRKGEMSETREKELNGIEFMWDPNEHSWSTQFNRLVAYKKHDGDCNVPRRYERDLEIWVKKQRWLKKRGKLDLDREKELDGIEFVWNPNEHSWRTQFNRLVAYKAQHSDCNVPYRYEPDLKLACWVDYQRASERRKKLDLDRKKELDCIGFSWSLHKPKV